MSEAQALDRVNRLGQTEEVVARRYLVKGSIEEVSYTYHISILALELELTKNQVRCNGSTGEVRDDSKVPWRRGARKDGDRKRKATQGKTIGNRGCQIITMNR